MITGAIIAGKANGTLRPGRYVRHANETPMANLFTAMPDRMSVPVETLGDANGRLGYLSDM